MCAAFSVAAFSVGEPRAAARVSHDFALRVPDLPASLLRAVKNGSYLGFDTNRYPGDIAMQAWRDGDSPYEWVGYYLPAPCHRDASWSGKRETLADMGWGMAVIYVGQQTWGAAPTPVKATKAKATKAKSSAKSRTSKKVASKTKAVARPASVAANCSRQLLTSAQGARDARDAISRAGREGFPNGTVIFLDVEYMEKTPAAMRTYYKSWVADVLRDGRFKPGIYVHTHNAALVYKDVKSVFAKAGANHEPAFWVAGAGGFTPDKAPIDVGHAFASAWQGRLDVTDEQNGIRLPIDVSVASVPSPSTHALGD